MAQTEQQDRLAALRELIAPVLAARGLALWGIEYVMAGPKSVVRIYIDTPDDGGAGEDGPEGVTIDQCADVSRHVGLLLEVEDCIPGSYILEVSSPGLERVFFEPAQLAGRIGSRLIVRLHEARDGRKRFKGVLKSVDGDRLTLAVDDGPEGRDVDMAWDEIKKARLIHHFNDSTGAKGGKR